MRLADTQLIVAMMAVQRGDLDGAVAHGLRALDYERKSGPSLLSRAAELDRALRATFPGERPAAEFQERFRLACREYAFQPPHVA